MVLRHFVISVKHSLDRLGQVSDSNLRKEIGLSIRGLQMCLALIHTLHFNQYLIDFSPGVSIWPILDQWLPIFCAFNIGYFVKTFRVGGRDTDNIMYVYIL